MKKHFLAFAFAATLAITSCKKEDTQQATPVTKETLSGSYKLASAKAQVSGSSSEIDLIANGYFDACEIDDVTTLKTDMSYAVVDAGTQCSPATDETGSWSISNSTTIVMDGETFTLKSWDGKTLVLTQSGDYNGISATITTTIVKQ